MNEKFLQNSVCCQKPDGQQMGINISAGPIIETPQRDEVCCCAPPGPQSSPFEKPGFALLDFVEKFVQTPAGPVPRVKTSLQWTDYAGSIRARLGINRNQYKIAPGLYCVGAPDAQAPLLVTANYKLTFDHLRKELASTNAWICLVNSQTTSSAIGQSRC